MAEWPMQAHTYRKVTDVQKNGKPGLKTFFVLITPVGRKGATDKGKKSVAGRQNERMARKLSVQQCRS